MLERGWQCTVKGGCSDIGAAKTPEGDWIDVLCPHCAGISRYGKRHG
jgi:hypothetical protein